MANNNQRVINGYMEMRNGFSINTLNQFQFRNEVTMDKVDCRYLTSNQKFSESNKSISIMSFNVRSMNANFDNFFDEIFYQFPCDIIGLCETRMTDATQYVYSIPNYNLFANNVASDMGGVCIYVREHLSCKVLSHFTVTTNHLETIFVQLHIDKNPLTIGMCYRRPDTPIALGERELTRILDAINTKCIVMGDFNANILRRNESVPVNSFLNNFYEYSFIPVIDKPTRVHNFTATLIDNIFVNFEQVSGYISNILFYGITDHFPVVFHYACSQIETSDTIVTYRKRSEACDNLFKERLANSNIYDVTLNDDVNSAFKEFNSTIYKIYDETYPLINKRLSGNSLKRPWLTRGIQGINSEWEQIVQKISEETYNVRRHL